MPGEGLEQYSGEYAHPESARQGKSPFGAGNGMVQRWGQKPRLAEPHSWIQDLMWLQFPSGHKLFVFQRS